MFSESFGGGGGGGYGFDDNGDEFDDGDARDSDCFDKTTPKTPVRKSHGVLQPLRQRHENFNRFHPYFPEWQQSHYPSPPNPNL